MALSLNVSPKGKSKNPNPKSTYDGIKLTKEDAAKLYDVLGMDPSQAGADAFNELIAVVTGEEIPESEQTGSKDGSRYIGKKMDLIADEDSTVFNNHALLAEALDQPANAQGSQLFRTALAKALDVLGKKAGVPDDIQDERRVDAIIAWRKNGGK